ncbi:MAG: copper chaperone PCu(A)C [Rhodospirillaceae bacterium]|nr:copper chaperone PCu(A)C [Rhodospirillaceae bacterium]
MHALRFAIPVVFALLAAGSALGQTVGSITVTDAWVRALARGNLGVTAYFQLVNRGQSDDRLVEVYSAPFGRATFGEVHTRGIVPKIEPLESIEVPANDVVRLRPGRIFVILTPQAQRMRPGMSVPLTLTFERSGQLEITARVTNQALGNLR